MATDLKLVLGDVTEIASIASNGILTPRAKAA